MEIKIVTEPSKNSFNQLAPHVMQSWEWGEFREKTGITVLRLGKFVKNRLTETAQITIHPIPHTSYTIGYFPKGGTPSEEMIQAISEQGKKYRCIFVKLEPNVTKEKFTILPTQTNLKISAHPLFTVYSFQLDLSPSEDELLKSFHSKTRYNIRVAQKHDVKIVEDNSPQAFNHYWKLTEQTTKRQDFFAHDRKYHELMWNTLHPTGIAHLFRAQLYENNVEHTLATWVIFLFNHILYYPYGASSTEYKNVMASNLMMWEVIRWGKIHQAQLFDMWGSLGPDANPKDPWYGFHRFKQGYNPKLIQFAGSFDLILNPKLYYIYNGLNIVRKIFLHLKRKM